MDGAKAMKTIISVLCLTGLLAVAQPARAELGKPISFIRVEGTQRVEAETVRAYMIVAEGMTVNRQQGKREMPE